MSEIQRLIERLCPQGVEFKKLGEVCDIKTGKLNANAQVENGLYPFYTCDAKPFKIDTYAFDTEAIIISGNGSQVGHVNYYNGKFNAYQRTYVLDNFRLFDISFIFHYLKGTIRPYIIKKSKKGSVPYITLPMLTDFEIPVPPLEVQSKIVEILDNFTELEAKLEAKLEAELEARRKQYEYYRNQLLTFEGNKDVKWMKLGEVAFYSKDRIDCSMLNENNYISVENLLKDKLGKVSATNYPSTGKAIAFIPGDILIGNIRPYLKKIWKANCDGGTNGDVLCIRIKNNNIIADYLFYLLSSDRFFDYDNSYAKGGKMPRGDKKAVLNYPIPIPPIAEQERIVSILDRFETLTTDLQSGLPAEIEARRKQYEYYREKLLTFKRKSA